MFMHAARARVEGDYPEAVPNDSGCTVRPLGGRRFEVRIWGKFPPGWLGGVTAGLTREHLSIVRGGAKKLSAAVWYACFEIDAAGAAANPASLDFLALTAERPQPVSLAGLRLESFHLERRQGALFVEVQGEDRLGFLVALLRCFSFYSLFPAELSVETAGGRIHDQFWLKGVGGMPPSVEAVQALREELQALCETRG